MTKEKVVLITGASAGFGHDTAKELLLLGYRVYATARRLEPMADLKALGAKLIKLDVTKDDDVLQAVEQIITEEGRIDIVYGNAGYGTYGNIENISLEEIKYQYDVNLFGQARIIQAVLPHMRKERAGRIILTASLVSHLSTAGLGWYASTKHALLGMGTALRQEVKDLGIDVVMIHPGAVKTEFANVAVETMDRIEYPEDYRLLMKGFRNNIVNSNKTSPGPESTVRAMVTAGTVKRPKTTYNTTRDAKVLKRIKALLSDRLMDKLVLGMFRKAATE